MLTTAARFNKASHTYDDVADIQHTCAEFLLTLIFNKWPHLAFDSVLDLGTGTGFIPQLLLSKHPHIAMTLNDLSPKMLARAREKLVDYPQIQYCIGDMANTAFDSHDLTLSNLAFQWIDDWRHLIRTHYDNTGILAFSCLLPGTFGEWGDLFVKQGVLSPVKCYPTRTEIVSFLKTLGPMEYKDESVDFTMTFTDAYHFMSYLRQLGASGAATQSTMSVLKTILHTQSQAFEVTYRVFFGVLRRI